MISIMETINYLVASFFTASTLLLAYLGYSFASSKKQSLRNFGVGISFVSLAFLIWTYIVTFHPANLGLVATVGVIPLFCAFIYFLLAAVSGVKTKYRLSLIFISGVILASFVVARFFLYESNPGFTDNGFFAFNVDPVVLYFYALILSFNFIPAVYVVGRHIKHDLFRVFFELGLTLVSEGLIIMVTNTDESVQIVNGVGIAIGLVAAALATAKYGLSSKTIK